MGEIAYSEPKFKAIAEAHTVLRGQVGSGLHGVTISGHDDRDEMGVCIEPPQYVIGNSKFEQYQFRTQPEGVRSGAGDLDLVVYSLRKWCRLAAQGNPTILLLLFLPPHEIVQNSWVGEQLQDRRDRFLSRGVAYRFAGYLRSQREQMLGIRGKKHTNRPELVDVHGFDTKFAYHMVRLGIQGVELLTTGRITLPIPEPDRTWLLDLRLGKYSKEVALARATELEETLLTLGESADLPERPDHAAIDRWLTNTYLQWWEERDLIARGAELNLRRTNA
jgi:hypothetical protein